MSYENRQRGYERSSLTRQIKRWTVSRREWMARAREYKALGWPKEMIDTAVQAARQSHNNARYWTKQRDVHDLMYIINERGIQW